MKNLSELKKSSPDTQSADRGPHKKSPSIYDLPLTPDLRNLLWIGIIFLLFVILPLNLITPPPTTPPPTQREQAIIDWLTYIIYACIIVGLLFWKATKRFTFDADSHRLTIRYQWLFFSLKLREIAFIDIDRFDLHFEKRRNAEYLTLLRRTGKPVLLKMKRKKDDLNFHLFHLNVMLEEFGGEQFLKTSVGDHSVSGEKDDETSYFGTPGHSTPSRDMDHKITLTPYFLLIVSPVLFLLSWLLTYAFYLLLSDRPVTESSSWWLLASCLLIALNCLWAILFLFYGLRVKDMELERDHGKLGGDPLFIPPRIMTRLTDILKVTYITPEKVPLYKNLRKILLGNGCVPILASFVFIFI
ncbi:MAG: hypothetical protein ACTSWW_02285 [Promethearchaeota archaeon]